MEHLYVSKEVTDIVNLAEAEVRSEFDKINKLCETNTMKVLEAFQTNQVSEVHFNETTGYGYDDVGRETIEKIFSQIFGTEDALVRGQFISASHALNVTLFGLLRPRDTLLSISGKPYDTMDEERVARNDVKVIEIQRSRGYSLRKSITLDKIEKAIRTIRKVNESAIIMIDNCYGEFTSEQEPSNLGADILVGSLIKNLGGGIAPNGAYVVGRKDLIQLVAERLTLPGEGRDVGPTLGMNKKILQGLFLAPSVVASSLKTAILTSKVMQNLGFNVDPNWDEQRSDIVQTIQFDDREKLIKYCQGIQMGSPIDSNSIPIPGDMPGYTDQVIMAAGAFTQGSSIELSCDAPLRPPYVAYQQGGLTYEYGKLGVMKAVENLLKK